MADTESIGKLGRSPQKLSWLPHVHVRVCPRSSGGMQASSLVQNLALTFVLLHQRNERVATCRQNGSTVLLQIAAHSARYLLCC